MSKRFKDIPTQARSVAADDFVPIDGASNATRKIAPQDAHGQFRNALAPRGGVAFDGNNSGAVLLVTPTNQNIGTDPFSISMFVSVPSAAPAVNQGLVCLSAQNNNTTSQALDVSFATAGLDILIRGASTSDYNRFTWNLYSLYAGKTIHLALVRPASGNLLVYVNAVDCTSLGSFSTNGTAPGWQGTILNSYLQVGNRNVSSFIGKLWAFTLYNLALAASDALEIFEFAGSVPERLKSASQAIALSESWSTANGWTANGACAVGGGFATVGSTGVIYKNALTNFQRGRTVRIRFDYTTSAAGNGTLYMPGYNQVPNPWYADKFLTGLGAGSGTLDATFLADTIYLTTGATGGIQFSSFNGGWQGTITNLRISWVGAVVHLPLDEGAGLQLRDASGNRLDAVVTSSGVSHILAQRRAALRTTLVFASSGNLQVFGQAAIDTARRWRIASVGGNSSAAVNLSLGNASGGAQYISAQAVNSDFDISTFASRLISGANLWVNSSGAATVTLVVNLEAID